MTMRGRVGAALIATLIGGLLGGASASAQVVSTGHSGWFWSNPVPQGEPLTDVSFAGGVGYAVGNFGTVLRTSDSGATWTSLPSGLEANLTEVDAITPASVIVAGGCVLRRSDDSGATFVRLPWTASDSSCPEPIAAVDFPTAATGYLLLGDGTILRTQDGGQSWARAASPPTPPAAIAFLSASAGFAAGSGVGIYVTSDGGTTWSLADGSAVGVSAMSLDGPTGVVAFSGFAPVSGPYPGATSPTLYVSGGGGQTWTSRRPNGLYSFSFAATHLDCVNGTGCLLSGRDGVFRTTDGVSFESVAPAGLTPTDAAFAGPAAAVVVTQEGIPAISSDGGATFSAAGAALGPGFYRLQVSSGALATLSGAQGEIALTSDGGTSWSVLEAPTTQNINAASFLTATTGLALEDTGGVLRTENAGSSWQTLSDQPGNVALLALDPDHALLAGLHGIERSSDGGQTFTRVLAGAALDELTPAGSAIVASGQRRIYVSSDGGARWRPMALPRHILRGGAIVQLDFMSARVGFVLGVDGRLFATSDGGKRWREVLGLGHGAILSIAFTSARSGWAAEGDANGTPGAVLRTDDGGRTWRPQQVGALQIGALGATGQDGYALDGIGHVFATGSAGDLGAPSSISLRAPRRPSKHGRVAVKGRLVPAPAGTSVEIGYRAVSGGSWKHKLVAVGPGGTFSLALRIAHATAFVAQWTGDVTSRGAGSPAVIVQP
jgi:photosystem II stability/assembly factor-like uncharacterized protein